MAAREVNLAPFFVLLDAPAEQESYRFAFSDARTPEQKKFRFVDFHKLTCQLLLGETPCSLPTRADVGMC